MNWFKKHIKKFLIAIGLLGVALAAGIGGIDSPLPLAVLATAIDGKQTSIEYTDDNVGEDLIIRTDKSEYMNFAGNVGFYFSIYNATKDDQNVKIAFSFNKDYQPEVWEYDGEQTYEVAEFHPATATSSEIKEYTTYRTVVETKWKELSGNDFTAKTIQRKRTADKTLKENSAFIKSGETKFFRANVKYLTKDREEFFIEAFGDNTYGHLDPWTYEINFNSPTYSTGDLNGQNTWTGSVNFDVITATKYEGDQGADGLSTTGWTYIDLPVDTVSGTMYFAVRTDKTNGAIVYINGYYGASQFGGIFNFEGDSNKMSTAFADGIQDWFGNYNADQWYIVKFYYDGVAHQVQTSVYDGSSWTDGALHTLTAAQFSNFTKFQIYLQNVAGTHFYFDNITATNPIAPPPSAAPSIESDLIIFE